MHTVIASLLKFKRDSSHPIRTFPVIHPCYLIPSLLICTECWDLLLVLGARREEGLGIKLVFGISEAVCSVCIEIYGANGLSYFHAL